MPGPSALCPVHWAIQISVPGSNKIIAFLRKYCGWRIGNCYELRRASKKTILYVRLYRWAFANSAAKPGTPGGRSGHPGGRAAFYVSSSAFFYVSMLWLLRFLRFYVAISTFYVRFIRFSTFFCTFFYVFLRVPSTCQGLTRRLRPECLVPGLAWYLWLG